MKEITETITVEGDGLTVPLIVWRRFLRPMPGLVEKVYHINPGLADLGPILPVGVKFKLPILILQNQDFKEPIRLW